MKNVEDIYPLSPMQELMLLSSRARHSADLLFNQVCFELVGELDTTTFDAGWQALTARHAALRTAFQWRGLKRPLQIVRSQVEVPLEVHDWRGMADDERSSRLAEYCREDRKRGFDLARAPLHRNALIRTGEQTVRWVWSSHHLVMDRWCISALFAEFATAYAAGGKVGAPVPGRAPGFGRYIAWLEGRDRAAARAFWRASLGDLDAPSPLAVDRGVGSLGSHVVVERVARRHLSADRAADLTRFARAHGLTMSTLVQVAWALTVNHHVHCRDVVFGVTVSGRPPDLTDIEAIIGTFVNNVPVLWRLDPDNRIVDYARAHQIAQQQRQSHDYLSLTDIHACSAVAPNRKLFDTLLVWLAEQPILSFGELTVRGQDSALQTAYALTLSIAEHGASFDFELRSGEKVELLVPVAQLIERFVCTLERLGGAGSELRFGDVDGFRHPPLAVSIGARAEPSLAGNDDGGGVDSTQVEGREQAALDMLTEMLSAEWEQVLGEPVIDTSADFFELGGDSLKAVQLHARVMAVTRNRIPLLTLFEISTIRGMAATIHAGHWPLSEAMATRLVQRGDGAPLFCIASPEVNTLGYALLARHLKSMRPVYLLQAPPDANEVRRLSPQELPLLAQRYADAVQSIQHAGPYHVLSMCVGAQLSFETVRLLESRGESAAFLGLVNTWSFFTVSRLIKVHRAANRLRWYRGRLADLANMPPSDRWQRLREILARKFQHKAQQKVSTQPSGAGPQPPGPMPVGDEWLDLMGRPEDAASVVPIQSAITVLRIAKQPFWRIRDRTLGWGRFTARTEVVDLAVADHDSILREPHVRDLALQVDRLLNGGRS